MPRFVDIDIASSALGDAARVMVIGCSGGGKSTLSRRIARRHGLPLVSIDRDVRWLPGWRERDKPSQREILARQVRRPRWVMDGSGASTFDLRLPRADLVIWVRVPRSVALAGLARRIVRYFGRVRPDMAPGCPEKLPDRAFLSYIWHFERRDAPRFVAALERHAPVTPVVVLRSRRDADALVP